MNEWEIKYVYHGNRSDRIKADTLELAIFDALPSALREAIASAEASVKPSVVRDTLLRGVPEQAIIEVINKRSPKP